jgi:hypothetical protein
MVQLTEAAWILQIFLCLKKQYKKLTHPRRLLGVISPFCSALALTFSPLIDAICITLSRVLQVTCSHA